MSSTILSDLVAAMDETKGSLWSQLDDDQKNNIVVVAERDGIKAGLDMFDSQVQEQESKAIGAVDATVEAEGNGEIRSVNGGKGKTRGRKTGETMAVLYLDGVVRRFSKKEERTFYLQCAIAHAKGDGGTESREAMERIGRLLPVVPVPVDISKWGHQEYMEAMERLM